MKFKDIPQLYSSQPMYHIDVPIIELKHSINRYITEYGLQLNPDFQRGHVWTIEQQIKYVEFILRGGRSGKEFYFNQPGWMNDWTGEFVCVDGLQRLNALLKFLNDELLIFEDLSEEGGLYLSSFEGKLSWSLTISFNINNLKTRHQVLEWYLEMNTGGTPHTQQELDKIKQMLNNLGSY